MTKINLKSVIEFLFWIILFVFALAFFNKSWDISFYFIIGALLFVLLIVEVVLNLEHRYKEKIKKRKEIKEQHKEKRKSIFFQELTSLFSFVVVLIVVFSVTIQKNKFMEFLSFKPIHLYFMIILVVIALIIMTVQFMFHKKIKKKKQKILKKMPEAKKEKKIDKKKKFELRIKIKYDFIFLFGLIVVIVAYIFKNWITAVLGLILMIVSLVVYYFTSKKIKEIELMKETTPKKIISRKIQKDQKLKLLLESPTGVITKMKKEEKRAKQEARMERLKLKELQRKIREEEKRKIREEKLRKRQEKAFKARGVAKQKKIEAEKKKLDKIRNSREKILIKEKKLGKIQKSREEIGEIIKTKKGLKQKAKYETDFDILLELIKKYERLKLSDVAKIFGVSIKKAEEWATILEQHNLLEIHYPAIGEPEIRVRR